jgi:hypothetical protein
MNLGLLTLVVTMGLQVAVVAGQLTASTNTNFFATLGKPKYVLVFSSGDRLFFRELGQRTVTMRVAGKDEIPELQFESVGSMAVSGQR